MTVQSIHTQPLQQPAFGLDITGVDIATADEATLKQIVALFHRHGAIVLRGQTLTPKQQIMFTSLFGPPAENSRPEFCDPDEPLIYNISNKIVNGKPIGDLDAGQGWHTDLSYDPRPALCTFLYAVEVPSE